MRPWRSISVGVGAQLGVRVAPGCAKTSCKKEVWFELVYSGCHCNSLCREETSWYTLCCEISQLILTSREQEVKDLEEKQREALATVNHRGQVIKQLRDEMHVAEEAVRACACVWVWCGGVDRRIADVCSD